MAGGGDELIHIRIQQRNGRKTLTTVQGIHEKFDKKKIVKVCKKVGWWSLFRKCCAGSIGYEFVVLIMKTPCLEYI